MDTKDAVKTAYEYLLKVSPEAGQFSNFRLEEVALDEDKRGQIGRASCRERVLAGV